eukprot:4938869-Amphidinium_carterae.1
MDYLRQLGCWVYVPFEEARKVTGKPPISTRWVDADKKGGSDPGDPDMRSRLVVQETRANSTIPEHDVQAVFSATPPLEGLRLLASWCMSTENCVLRCLDISRAHQNCDLERKVYIRLPKEDPKSSEGWCGLLVKALNGVRDAAKAFELRVTELTTKAGALQGSFNPCMYYHEGWGVRFLHHGDDFVVAGE